MKKCKIHLIVATRPNFVKIAPVYNALVEQSWCEPEVVYFTQHFSPEMSLDIARDLGMDDCQHIITLSENLQYGSRFGEIMAKYNSLLINDTPDLIVVPGDVDTSAAVAICAKRKGLPVAHLESGLRSFDMTMPEEINRMLIDSISDILLAPSNEARDYLVATCAKPSDRVVNVGNIMIDSLVDVIDHEYGDKIIEEAGLLPHDYCMMTFHRPSNVDRQDALEDVLRVIKYVAKNKNVVLPVHPRLKASLEKHNLLSELKSISNLKLHSPMGYKKFINYMSKSSLIITDSGGVQEEAAFLKRVCLTFRDNTERPQTVECGSNILVSPEDFYSQFDAIAATGYSINSVSDIPLWDGRTRFRVANSLRFWWLQK